MLVKVLLSRNWSKGTCFLQCFLQKQNATCFQSKGGLFIQPSWVEDQYKPPWVSRTKNEFIWKNETDADVTSTIQAPPHPQVWTCSITALTLLPHCMSKHNLVVEPAGSQDQGILVCGLRRVSWSATDNHCKQYCVGQICFYCFCVTIGCLT